MSDVKSDWILGLGLFMQKNPVISQVLQRFGIRRQDQERFIKQILPYSKLIKPSSLILELSRFLHDRDLRRDLLQFEPDLFLPQDDALKFCIKHGLANLSLILFVNLKAKIKLNVKFSESVHFGHARVRVILGSLKGFSRSGVGRGGFQLGPSGYCCSDSAGFEKYLSSGYFNGVYLKTREDYGPTYPRVLSDLADEMAAQAKAAEEEAAKAKAAEEEAAEEEAAKDGAAKDGAAKDGAAKDGAAKDGAAKDGAAPSKVKKRPRVG